MDKSVVSIRAHGPVPLDDRELLEVLLRPSPVGQVPGTAVNELLRRYPQLIGLANATFDDLRAIPGIGIVRARTILSAVELGHRVQVRQFVRQGDVVSSEELSKQLIRRFSGQMQEVLLAILLDAKNSVITEVEVSRGGLDKSLADPRVVFRQALLVGASRFILTHNHPSGDPDPSPADIETTVRFMEVGSLLGITLLDHIIVGATDAYSFHATQRL